jgi:hypothetical protein
MLRNLTRFAGFDFGDDPNQLVKIDGQQLVRTIIIVQINFYYPNTLPLNQSQSFLYQNTLANIR